LYPLLRSLLFRLPPELAHEIAMAGLRVAQAVPPICWALERGASSEPALETRVLGLTLRSPVGLAAGFDKNAFAVDALVALGFGFVEAGTVTARPQPGNPRPRLFRLSADRALINRMGFNNHGAAAAAIRLASRRGAVVGVNIGKTKLATEAETEDDFAASARAVARIADYVVVNVSSPNTPGLRDLQAATKLAPILKRVRRELDAAKAGSPTPLLVKIAPDLADDDVDAVTDVALELGLDGIVATNTTVRRDGLRTPDSDVQAMGAGGLSGPPVAARALDVVRRVRTRSGGKLVIVAAGGIETAKDAWDRIRAGASLVQVYTGFVYGGPRIARDIGRGLVVLARAAGYANVSDAVGSEGTAPARACITRS